MIDHVSGLDWKKNLRSLDWKKNLRSKNGIFKKLPLPIFCVLLLECQPFKKIALFGKHVLPAVFLTQFLCIRPTLHIGPGRCVCVHT